MRSIIQSAAAIGIILICGSPIGAAAAALSPTSVDLEVEIEENVASVEAIEVFHNGSSREMEGTFLFPIPSDASIGDFSMWVDGKEMGGELLDADEARAIYEEIVRRRRDPGLLEYVGHGLYKLSLFPIPPGEDRKIHFSYRQHLPKERGLRRLMFPLPYSEGMPDDAELKADISITSGRESIHAIYSPTHRLQKTRLGSHAAEVEIRAPLTGDCRRMEIYYEVSEEDLSLDLLTYKERREDGYFMLMLYPGESLITEDDQPLRVMFVFDTSGSMRGEKIQQAREALLNCLAGLEKDDRFNVITFSSSVRPFESGLVEASPQNLAEAEEFVLNLNATGGTNIAGAMEEVAQQLREEEGALILFLTDGLPTTGETDLKKIEEKALSGIDRAHRLFAFGVGYDVNTHLLDRLSSGLGGKSEYVLPDEDIEVKVSLLYQRLVHPVLTDVEVDFEGAPVYDVFPKELWQIYPGEEVILTGRFRPGDELKVRIGGKTADGHFFATSDRFELPRRDLSNDFVGHVWATRKVGTLLNEIRLEGETPALVEELVKVASRFGVVTSYTSFLVEEPSRVAHGGVIEAGEIHVRGGRSGEVRFYVDGLREKTTGTSAVHQALEVKAMDAASQPLPGAIESTIDRELSKKAEAVRTVGSKSFIQTAEGIWRDTEIEEGLERIAVAPFSKAYFRLLERIEELGRYLTVGEHVELRLDKILLVVEEGGAEDLESSVVERIIETAAEVF